MRFKARVTFILLLVFLVSALLPLAVSAQPPTPKCPDKVAAAITTALNQETGYVFQGGCSGFDTYWGHYSTTLVSENGNSYTVSFQIIADANASVIHSAYLPNFDNLKKLIDYIEKQPVYLDNIGNLGNPSRGIATDEQGFFGIFIKHEYIYSESNAANAEAYTKLPHLYFYYGEDKNWMVAYRYMKQDILGSFSIAEFQPLTTNFRVEREPIVLPEGYTQEYYDYPQGPSFVPSHIFEFPHQLWVGLTVFFLALYWVLRKRIEKSRFGELFNDYWLGEKHFSNHSIIWGLLLMSIVFLVFDFVSHNSYFTIRDALGFDVYQGMEVLVSSIIGLMLLALWFNVGKNLGKSDHPIVWSVVAPFLHFIPLGFIFAYLFTYVTFGGTPYIGGFFDSLFLLPKLLPFVASLGLFLNFKPKLKKKQGFMETFSQKIPLIILILTGLFWGFLIFVELFVSTQMILY